METAISRVRSSVGDHRLHGRHGSHKNYRRFSLASRRTSPWRPRQVDHAENSPIIADHRRVVIGRMSRRRWAPRAFEPILRPDDLPLRHRRRPPLVPTAHAARTQPDPSAARPARRSTSRARRSIANPGSGLRSMTPPDLRAPSFHCISRRGMGRGQKMRRYASERSESHEDDGPAEPPPRPRFRRLRRPHEPLEFDLRESLPETLGDGSLNLAPGRRRHGSGEGSRSKRNFDQEPRRLDLVDRRFENRVVLDQHRLSSWGSSRAPPLIRGACQGAARTRNRQKGS